MSRLLILTVIAALVLVACGNVGRGAGTGLPPPPPDDRAATTAPAPPFGAPTEPAAPTVTMPADSATTPTTAPDSPAEATSRPESTHWADLGHPIRSLAALDDLAIAVGPSIWISEDHERWERVDALGSSLLEDVAVAGAGAVAVGPLDVVLFSRDGRVWQQIGLPAERASGTVEDVAMPPHVRATAIASSRRGFVAAGTTVWYSRDGRHWKTVVDDLIGPHPHLAANGDGFVLLVGDDVWTSPDGETWARHPGVAPTSESAPADTDPTCPGRPEQIDALHATPDGYFLTEGLPIRFGGPAIVWASDDGIHWDPVTLPDTGRNTAGVLAFAYDAGRYLALGIRWDYPPIPLEGFPGGGCGPSIVAAPVAWASTDGLVWTLVEESPPFSGWAATHAWFTSAGDMQAWILDGHVFASLDGRQFTWQPEALRDS